MKRNITALFTAGLIGGVVVAGLFTVTGITGNTTTVISSANGAGSAQTVATQDGAKSARDIYRQDAPGVVFIKSNVTRPSNDPFGFGGDQSGVATGSGFVISDKGFVLTNFHVVNGASSITVTFDDKKTVSAQVVGRDASTDLALLRVDPSKVSLHPLTLGHSSDAVVGDPVLAIGNPFGLDRTLTTGVVSALQRSIKAPNGFTINDVIQTDAAINPGNSGGPLLNSNGEVIGVNSQIETGGGSSSGNVGIGFAVPIDTARKILTDLESGRSIERGWLGVEVATIDDSLSSLKLSSDHGALIQKVTAGGPAANAGLKGGTRKAMVSGQPVSVGGDVIVSANGHKISTAEDLQIAIGGEKPGAQIKVTIKRGSETLTKTVTLGKRPSHG